jgi:hypothetical protein
MVIPETCHAKQEALQQLAKHKIRKGYPVLHNIKKKIDIL